TVFWRHGLRMASLGSSCNLNGEGVFQFQVPDMRPATGYKVRVISAWNPDWFVENEGWIAIGNMDY
ncbi:MAG: hypothetical protein M1457_02010, partial [bacterium]|nr:hypothetical protein [bacterium]